MERTRGFEPLTRSVETNCSNSVELRPRMERMKVEKCIKEFLFIPQHLAGALRFELRTSVLETGILPIETMRLFEFFIADFGLKKSQIVNIWSERRESNPQHSVWKTDTQPFEFRSQKIGVSGRN